MDKLYINNQPIDMGEEVDVYLTYRSNIMGEIDSILGNNSATIKIPNTEQNARIIGYAHIIASQSTFPFRIHQATLYRNGLLLVHNATAILLSANADEFELCLAWGASEGMRQLAESGDTLPMLHEQNDKMEEWYDLGQLSPSWRFPEAAYGFARSLSNGKYWYHPVVGFDEILYLVKQRYNLNVQVSPRIEEQLQNLVMVVAGSATPKEEAVWNFYYNANSAEFGITAQGGAEYFDVNTSSHDGVVLSRVVIDASVKFIGATTIGDPAALAQDALRIMVSRKKKDEDKYDDILEIPCENITQSSSSVFEYTAVFNHTEEGMSEVFDEGDKLIFRVLMKPVGDIVTQLSLRYSGLQSESKADMTLNRNHINVGENYYIVRNLPDVEILDWLKGTMQMLGLFAYQEGDTIVIKDYVTYSQDKQKAQDWSKWLVMGEYGLADEHDFSLDGYYQVNRLTYKNDNKNNAMDGSFTVDNATLEYEGNLIELPFESYAATTSAWKTQLARLPFYKQVNEDSSKWNPTTEEDSIDASKMYVCKRTAGNYLSREGLDWASLLSEYYPNIIESISKARYITVNVYMDAVTLRKVDLGIPVYLSQYAAYFAIIEIKTKKHNINEVKLLKIV